MNTGRTHRPSGSKTAHPPPETRSDDGGAPAGPGLTPPKGRGRFRCFAVGVSLLFVAALSSVGPGAPEAAAQLNVFVST